MCARILPPDPSLEQLKKQAKALLAAHRAGDAAAVSRLRSHVPQLSDFDRCRQLSCVKRATVFRDRKF